jgi:hypothetical protein
MKDRRKKKQQKEGIKKEQQTTENQTWLESRELHAEP